MTLSTRLAALLCLAGAVSVNASLTVDPLDISRSLDAGATETASLSVENTGSVPVEWNALAEQLSSPSGPASLASGQDGFGYRWADSTEPDGPVFEWVDLSPVGNALKLADDDSAVVPLPFTFVFYGAEYEVVRISSNGYLTFGPDGSDHTNDPVPSAADPNALIAAYWTDLDPALGGSIVTYHDSVNNRFIVQYTDIQPFGGGDPVSFQAIMHQTGDIVFHYNIDTGIEALGETITVGIENADGSIGSSVAYDSTTVSSGLSVRFYSPTWLSVSPENGTLDPGETAVIEVTLNAGALIEGLYEGLVRVEESGLSPVDVPVSLTVSGEPGIVVQPDSLVFEPVGVGGTRERTLTITNTGTADLTIGAITFSDPDFYTASTLPLVIAPATSQQFQLVHAPTAAGPVNATATVISDATGIPAVEVNLVAEGLDPADISISPGVLNVSLPAGDTAQLNLDISNTGIAPLNWESVLNGDVPTPAAAAAETPAVEPDFTRDYATDRLIVGLGDDTRAGPAGRDRIRDHIAILADNTGATRRRAFGRLGNLEVWELKDTAKGPAAKAVRPYRDKPKQRVKALVQWLRKQEHIKYAEPDYRIQLDPIASNPAGEISGSEGPGNYPGDPSFGLLWGMDNIGQEGGSEDADIDAPEAWLLQTGAEDIIVAVIDTGVDYLHEDLAANMWINTDEIPENGLDDDGNGYVDDIYGWDWVNGDRDPMDDHDHGSHCAGTIGGVGDNGIGVTGVAWNTRIMALKFLDANGSGYLSDALYAIDYATANGARITSNSWGGGGYSQAMVDSITHAANEGVLFVAAAGNDSRDNDVSPQYPASYELPEVVSVAATTRFDTRAYFSNYGEAAVDLGAPGAEIFSTKKRGTYGYFSGTSMATPHVSGAAAMVLAKNPLLSPVQVKQILMDSTDPLADLAGKTVTGGRLNLRRALDQVSPPWFFIEPKSGVIAPGATELATVRIEASFLPEGPIEGTITLFSDDPDEPVLNVPVSVTVTSAPAVKPEPASLDFGDVFLGGTASLDLLLANSGTAELIISTLVPSGPFSAGASLPIILQAGERAVVPVEVAGLSLGNLSGSLAVGSNDPTDPLVTVPLSATCIEAPQVSTIPGRIDFDMVSGALESRDLTVSNNGASTLQFVFSGSLPDWLSIGPLSGTLPPGGNGVIELQVDTTGLSAGQYAAETTLESNDPLTPGQRLLIVLNLTDGPVLTVQPEAIEFGGIHLGYPQERSVTVRNTGNQDLVVSSTSVGGTAFSLVTPWSGTLVPGSSTTLAINADPASPGTLSGSLTIVSNDPVNPSLVVPLAGNALEVPAMVVSPTSFSFSLNEGQSTMDGLLIDNTGLETLEVSLEVQPEGGGLAFGEIIRTTDLDEATGDETIFAAEYLDGRFYVGGANRGPNVPMVYVLDKEGNYIREFPLPGVPAGYYGVYDMASDGQFLYGGWAGGIVKFDTAGNLVSSLPLPEEFSVIAGIAHDPATGHLWINGFAGDILEIEEDGTILSRHTAVGLDNSYGMAWDDASPGGPFLWIMEKKELATRKVHQFDPDAGTFTGLTFTVNPAIGWSAGLSFTSKWQEGQATLIPVTQAEENRWLHVVNIADVQSWLSLDTYAASIPPGGSDTVNLDIDSTGVLGGAHLANIVVTGNDPANPSRTIPVDLTVFGIPGIELPGFEVIIPDPVFIGNEAIEGFRIRNTGTDVLSVTALTVYGSAFGLVDDAPFTLDPQQSRELEITFQPASTGIWNALLVIESDDPQRPSINVLLEGTGVPEPVIDIDATPVTLNLFAGETTDFTISIGNTGGSTLAWQASPHNSATLTSMDVEDDAGSVMVPGTEPAYREKTESGDLGIFADLIESTPKSVPWADGFEDGRFTDSWYMTYTSSKTEVSNTSAGEGTYSFHAYAATDSGHFGCIYQVFETSQPDYFSFRVRSDNPDEANAYVVLGEQTWQLQSAVYFFNTQTSQWFMGDNYDSIQTASEAERWYLIECRDIDWTSRTFDYYIDGTLVERGLGFRSPDSTAVNRLHIYNYRKETSGWWDDIRLSVDTAEWMRMETAAAEAEASSSTSTRVSVSAGYIEAGTYEGHIIVRSNDPATPETAIPVTLNVTSAPGIHLPQTAVDFGGIVQGGSTSAALIVSNSGTETLTITGLTFSDPAFSSNQALPFTLQPGEQTVVALDFTAGTVSDYSGTLTLESNCPVAHAPITLAGEGLQPPGISTDTTPIALSVPAGENTGGSLVIDNIGAGNLELEAFLFTEAVSGGGAPTEAGVLTAGGPDNFGYTFRDERDPDGPMYQWEEIAIPEGGNGLEVTQLTGFTASSDATQNDDAYVWPYNLPFTFPFYGSDYSEIAVGAYGVTYFEDDGFGWYMRDLPTDNVASGRGTNTFISTFNDNLDILPGAIYTEFHPDKAIIQHYRVTSLFQEWATFQTILYPNGDIRMQWYETGPWLTGTTATIGIQGDSSTALQYGRRNNLVEDGRCIYYTHPGNPYRDWLQSGNRTSSIPGGESHTLDYTIKGEFLLPGTYNGHIELRSNDAGQPVVTIPVTVTVTDPSSSGLALVRNFTALVPEGGSVVITDSNLLAASPAAGDDTIVYTVTSTGDGLCRVDGSPAASFTQADIKAGLVDYEHDGSDTSTSTSLGFMISDGVDTIGPVGLTLNVSAINDPPVLTGPAGFGGVEGIYTNLAGMDLEDPDISQEYAQWSLSLKVDHGKVRFEYVPGGVNFYGGDAVQNNDTANVSVQTWLSRLQANLRTPGGIQYMPDPGYTGPDTLTVIVNDNGNTGTGPAYMEALYVPIEVYGSDIERWRHVHFSETDLGDPLLEPTVWGDNANPDKDPYTNLFEYLLLGDPLMAENRALIQYGYDGIHLSMRFAVRKQHPGVAWHGQWSNDLNGTTWTSSGIVSALIEELESHDLMELRIPMVDPGSKFMRLEVERE